MGALTEVMPVVDAQVAPSHDDRLARKQEYGLVLAQQRRRLEAIARNILRDSAAAEDAVSEAVVRVWLRLQKHEPDNLVAYLVQAVRNEALTQLRCAERERAAVRAVGPSLATDNPEGRVDDRDEVERLLTELPQMQQATLRLRYDHGRSEVEIADTLGIAPGTVKGYAHRGLRRMRARALAA